MVFTDPPYNVDYGNHGNKKWGNRHAAIKNDKLSDSDWLVFQKAWMTTTLEFLDGAIYICMSAKEWATTRQTFVEVGGHWSSDIIWVKDRLVLGRKDYHSRYEAILYGWKEGSNRTWNGGRNQNDVWEIKRPSVNDLHPTMKPVALVAQAIEHASDPDGLIYDPFSGSGTTIIAAEQTSRRAVAMELEPGYVAVTLERFQEQFGVEPKLVHS